MQPNLKTSLVTFQYDALNRLVASTPSTQDATQRFYLKDHLVTEIQGTVQRSIMQHGDQLLAQQQRQSGALETGLLATDQQRSVLNVLDRNRPNPLAHTPYGYRPLGNGLLSLLGFNGERPDVVTGWYLLGAGHHRPFNPVLGCFICPDSWSPFGAGGLSAYAYCAGDPINRSDPTGHFGNPVKGILNLLKLRASPMTRAKRMARANEAYTRAKLEYPFSPNRSQNMLHKPTATDISSTVSSKHINTEKYADANRQTPPRSNRQAPESRPHSMTSTYSQSSQTRSLTTSETIQLNSSLKSELSHELQLALYKMHRRDDFELQLEQRQWMRNMAVTNEQQNILDSSIAHWNKIIREWN